MLDTIKREITRVLSDHANRANAGACLYIAHAVASVLHNAGLRPIIQAGCLQWPIMAREEDDGRSPTHFAYMWEPSHPASVNALAAGALPEMHVWVGLTSPAPTLIDFSTANLRIHAEACGLTWRSGDPPEYVWATEEQMPDWVVYTPVREATLYACKILKGLFDPPYLNRKG